MLNNEIIFYGGMPRSGSHLLSGILNQNPLFHSEGLSALCRILWDIDQSVSSPVSQEELRYFGRDTLEFKKEIAHSIVNIYYKNIKNSVVLDKNRSWTMEGNIGLIKDLIQENPKFIVMIRNVEEVVKSFVSVYMLNGYSQSDSEKIILNFNEIGQNPFMRPIAAVAWAKTVKNDKEFLFIDYDDLLKNTDKVIESIYNFIDRPLFIHNFNNIVMDYIENSGHDGLVNVRKTISKNKNNIILSKMAKEKIEYIEYIFDLCDSPEKNMKEIKDFCYSNRG